MAAFRYQNGVMEDFGTLASSNLFSAATSLNTDDMCGYADNADQSKIVPVCWIQGQIFEYPILGGEDGYVDALNESGHATGYLQTPTGAYHCTFWPVTGGAVDCHSDQLGAESFATDLNSAAQIVGYARLATVFQYRAFLVLPWGMLSLPRSRMARTVRHTASTISERLPARATRRAIAGGARIPTRRQWCGSMGNPSTSRTASTMRLAGCLAAP